MYFAAAAVKLFEGFRRFRGEGLLRGDIALLWGFYPKWGFLFVGKAEMGTSDRV